MVCFANGRSSFVEYVFDWKGVGVAIVDALEKYDLPVVMGAVLFISIIWYNKYFG